MKANRWVYAIVGIIVMLCAGLIYAWTNISKPIRAEIAGNTALNITPENLAMTFSICMAMFCLGGLLGGIILKKRSAKISILLSIFLFPIGLTIASNTNSYVGLYIGYGIFVGFAAGLVYNAVLSVVTKWFQDKQGLISGLLLMGFGLGGFLLGPIAKSLSDNMGWRQSFIVIGIAIAIILLLSIFFFVLPGDDFITPVNPNKKAKQITEGTLDIGPLQMIKRPSFWCYFLWTTLLSSAGLFMIPNANQFAQSIGAIDEMGLVLVAGTISIFNGLGRVLFGFIFDKKGRKVSVLIDTTLFIVASLILIAAISTGSILLTIIGFIGVGLAYGGIPSNNSAFVNTYYGNNNYPLNLPIMNLTLLVASFIGPNIAQSFIGSSIGFIGVLLAMIVFSVIALIASFLVKRA